MDKIDLKKALKHLYNPSPQDFMIVDVPALTFLMLDGHGDPNHSQEYQQAVEALYSLSYALKFAVKKSWGIDYGVMPLEGLWWVEDMAKFSVEDKSAWDWTMMILQPEYVTQALFAEICTQVARKKELPALKKMRFETFHESLAVQIMHLGPYSAEGPTLERMHHAFIPENGLEMVGKHHEIYLGDPRKTAPEKLKTVLRQPVRRV